MLYGSEMLALLVDNTWQTSLLIFSIRGVRMEIELFIYYSVGPQNLQASRYRWNLNSDEKNLKKKSSRVVIVYLLYIY